ncbi:MAG: glycosyltransferase family 4 protein [Methanomicrobiales archaeon]
MKVNIFVEDFLFFRYIGCATAAKSLYRELHSANGVEVLQNSYRDHVDITHYHTFGPLALTHRRFTDGKTVLTAHSTPRINEGNVAFYRAINRHYPRIYRKFDHIVTISEPCHQEVQSMIPDHPVTLIPNGIDREYFRPDSEKRRTFRERYGIDEDATVILTVAQQTPRKGIYDFLELAHQRPDLIWVWVGGYPYGMLSKDYFQIRDMRDRCHSHVIFTGIVPDIAEAYCGADIFFMPSYAETFGLVILEALSCGLPVIARDIDEFQSIFSDDIMYFSTIGEASDAIDNESLIGEFRKQAREKTRPYDISRVADRHIDLYRELIES